MSEPATRQVSNWNVPNALTTLRIVMVPFFGWALLHDGGHDLTWRWVAFALFVVAMITDKIDGDLARKHDLVTDFGKIADPIADKAMTGMAFIGLAIIADFLPAWLWWTITDRGAGCASGAVTFARLSIASEVVMPAKQSGKVKTTMQVVALGGFVAPFGLLDRRPRGARRRALVDLGGRAGRRGRADDHLRAGVRARRRTPPARRPRDAAQADAGSGPRAGGRGRPGRSRGCRSRPRRTACDRLRDRSTTTSSQSSAAQVLRRSSSPLRTTSMNAIAASTAIRVASGASWGTAWMCQPRSSWSTSWGSAWASARISLIRATRASSSRCHSARSRGRRARTASSSARRRPGRRTSRCSSRKRTRSVAGAQGVLARAGAGVGVDQRRGGRQRDLGVMGKSHVDS